MSGGHILKEILEDFVQATTKDLKLREEIASEGLEMRINSGAVLAVARPSRADELSVYVSDGGSACDTRPRGRERSRCGGEVGGAVASRLIRLRYAGTCSGCALGLPAGTKAWWDADARTTTCVGCRPVETGATTQAATPAAVAEDSPPVAPSPRATGEAGGSARREYERRHQRREQQIDQRWGRLAGVVKFLSDDPQSITAWAKGSDGERRLAAQLLRSVGDRAVLLHDRKVPGTRGNIDHLAIAASGIWVIDAKHYKGMVERRDVGGWFRTNQRLYVGGRDRTRLADGLAWQIDAVRKALGGADVQISAALCFIEAEWKLFAKPFQYNGVWVTWAKKLAKMIAEPGPLTPVDVTHIADRLAATLPPAVRAT